ncbi:DUF1836 domain-containing protein [Clostridium autoethanogenum]|uniref:DUF1836 domain-containing protein n=2 Tax=Clostridium autoethanogenum TaxID=84023 RepID=A0A3M0S3S2_9CLOT|nr:DUF1836 domain-containing protein [Clostridium autoethanogenum]AGY75820.1 DUF1836 domain-containing protein [Clostridium autoethanogenum DSM 10061]ALU35985.1 hypothetical protein CLAU_1556 [Clostridium autoethanogenum DSM 10061]OVY51957.1 hypothetical protein WX72_00834 [Clostridium autoethanogenum]RMC93099.1 DUF1836 domain-containing protein [Clostridium autoethanogenum]
MDKTTLDELTNQLGNFTQLKLESIPDIDLYMDQVTTFIEEKLGYLKRNKEDTAITKTMINNYTKAGILMPPKKKKYSKQHMILIILTYYLKQILSIGDIQSLFSSLAESIKEGEDHTKDLDKIYQDFLKIEKIQVEDFVKDFKSKITENDTFNCNGEELEQDENKLITVVVMLIVRANIEKKMAESIIDNFFGK